MTENREIIEDPRFDQEPVPIPRPVRRCGHCRQPGHSIGSCADPSITEKLNLLVKAADYCLAYQPEELFLRIRLRALTLPMLKLVALKFGIGGIQGTQSTVRDTIMTALTEILYTTPKSLPGYQERAKAAIEAPENVSALAEIDELLTQLFIPTIENAIRGNDTYDQYFIKPTCPREHAIYDELLLPHLEQRRHFVQRSLQYARQTYNRARDNLANAREDYRRVDEMHKNTVARLPPGRNIFNIKMVMADNAPVANTIIPNDNPVEIADAQVECPICYNSIPCQDMITTNCSHQFCQGCITKTFDMAKAAIDNNTLTFNPRKIKCAMCRTVTTKLTFNNQEIMNAFI